MYLGGYHKGTVPKLQFLKCPHEEKVSKLILLKLSLHGKMCSVFLPYDTVSFMLTAIWLPKTKLPCKGNQELGELYRPNTEF